MTARRNRLRVVLAVAGERLDALRTRQILLAEAFGRSTCRKCGLPITFLGGDWTCTEGDMYGLTNCGADLSAPYTPHEPLEG
jgi:hypothetical protein